MLLFYNKQHNFEKMTFEQLFNTILSSLEIVDNKSKIKQKIIYDLEHKYFYKISNYDKSIKIESVL